MQLDGLLAFLNGLVEIAFAGLAVLLVANGVKGNNLGEVVFVGVFLLKRAVDVGHGAVVIGVVACVERMPPAALRGVFLRRACCREHYECQQQKGDDMFKIFQLHFLNNSFSGRFIV